MMNKASGMVCYVEDPLKTVEFYRALGFRIDKAEADHVSVGLKDFWLDFHPQASEDKPEFQREARADNKGAGLFLYIKVDDVDEFYKQIITEGLRA